MVILKLMLIRRKNGNLYFIGYIEGEFSTPTDTNANKDILFNEKWILLCREGRWVGYLTEKILKDIPVQNWDKKFLYEFSSPIDELPSISEKELLWKEITIIENTLY